MLKTSFILASGKPMLQKKHTHRNLLNKAQYLAFSAAGYVSLTLICAERNRVGACYRRAE
jgi:hypothetical protein